jgi:hypothetical protein
MPFNFVFLQSHDLRHFLKWNTGFTSTVLTPHSMHNVFAIFILHVLVLVAMKLNKQNEAVILTIVQLSLSESRLFLHSS